MYYVYELIDPRTNAAFYVGKGKADRIGAHEIEARKGRVSRKCARIREIEGAGLSVVKRKVKHFADEQEAYDFEAELIEQYPLSQLTNIMAGGGGGSLIPTLSQDRLLVRIAAEAWNRTCGGKINRIWVMGRPLDLRPFLENNIRKAAEVIERRGVDWANSIALRFGVTFHLVEG